MLPIIYRTLSEEELAIQPDSYQPDVDQLDTRNVLEKTGVEETTLAHFCEFVDFYTRHARNPLCTALTCEQQVETIRITDQDLCPETIHLLIDTMLTAIDHLEKKWLDEQIHCQESEQRFRRDLAHRPTNSLPANGSKRTQTQKSPGIGHVFAQSARWVRQHLGRHKPAPRELFSCPNG